MYNALSFAMLSSSRLGFLAILALAVVVGAAEPSKAIALLAERCLKCHNSSVRMSGLSLASASGCKKGRAARAGYRAG
jgi:cytochrome c551/c552